MASDKKKRAAAPAAPPAAPNTLARTVRSMRESTACEMFTLDLDESDMRKLRITMPSVTFLADYDQLFKDLERLDGQFGVGDSAIVYEIWFGKNYPRTPPFVRVVSPRLEFHTGHITVGGSVCTELLTISGWRPELSGENLILFLHQLLIDGGARVDFVNRSPYSFHEARDAYVRVAKHHGWEIEH